MRREENGGEAAAIGFHGLSTFLKNVSVTRSIGRHNHDADYEMFEQALAEDRSVLQVKDSDGWGLIHLGIHYHLDNCWLLAMMRANPAVAGLRCEGRLPLQMILAHEGLKGSDTPVLLRMLDCYPEAARCAGLLPLSAVLRAKPFDDALAGFVDRLLDLYPEATRIKTADGSLPLHLALIDRKPLHMILRILRTHPGAAVVADSKGALPLQIALRYHEQVSLIVAIFEAYPAAVLRPITSADWTGSIFEYFARENIAESVLRIFLEDETSSPRCAACSRAAWYALFTEDCGDVPRVDETRCKPHERLTVKVRSHKGETWEFQVWIHSTGKMLKTKIYGVSGIRPCNQVLKSRRERIGDDDKIALFWYGAQVPFDLELVFPIIHAYIQSPLPLPIVSKVLDLCPDFAMAESDLGMLPLETAIRYGREPELVLKLFHLFPGAARQVTHVPPGDSLLRVAIEHNHHHLTEELLMGHTGPDDWDPGGILKIEVLVKLKNKAPMLHVAIAYQASVANLGRLIESGYPVAAVDQATQDTALDVAIAHNAQGAVFDLVFKHVALAIPDCLVHRKANGKTVMHKVLEGNPTINMVRALCRHSSEALAMMDHDGRYPIHYAAMGSADVACIREVIMHNTAPVGETDHLGFLPVQLAVISAPQPGVVHELIGAQPHLARTRDRNGNSLLRMAVLDDAPRYVIQEILDTVPEAMNEVNVLDSRWMMQNKACEDVRHKALHMRRAEGK